MFLGVPWQFWAVILPGPALLLGLRLVTWAARFCGWRRNRRPGYLDLQRHRFNAERRRL